LSLAGSADVSRTAIRCCLVLLFFACILVFHLTPVVSPDLPWHLKTGEHILRTHSIPKTDVFSYAQDEIPFIGQFILSQYWLSQIVLYRIYDWSGPGGLVVTRALLVTGIAFLLWTMIRKRGLFFSLFVVGAYTAYMLQPYIGARPALFTLFLCTLLFKLLLEYCTTRRRAWLYPLPPLMILWANLHGGFIFGNLIIGIVIFSAAVNTWARGMFLDFSFSKKDFAYLSITGFLAILCSVLNPSLWDAFFYAFTTHHKEMYTAIIEYESPLSSGTDAVMWTEIVQFWLTLALPAVIVLLSLKKRQILPVLLVGITTAMAFQAVRYIPFLVICATFSLALLDIDSRKIFSEDKSGLRDMVLLCLAVAALGLKWTAFDPDAIRRFPETKYYSVSAADFLEKNEIYGKMFASYNKAAFLMFKLFPNSSIFMDNRFISQERMAMGGIITGALESRATLSLLIHRLAPGDLPPLEIRGVDEKIIRETATRWEEIFDQTGTEIVVHEALQVFSGELMPIVLRLALHDGWKLVYTDGIVMVYLKDIEKYRDIIEEYEKPVRHLYAQLIAEGLRGANQEGRNAFMANYALGAVLSGYHDKAVGDLVDRVYAADPQNVSAEMSRILFRLMNGQSQKNNDGQQP
jgi:hypothetical protein